MLSLGNFERDFQITKIQHICGEGWLKNPSYPGFLGKDFRVPGFWGAQRTEVHGFYARPEPQKYYHRFVDTISRYAKTLRHLLSTMDKIVEGAISTTIVAA